VDQPLVVVVDGDREDFFGAVLVNYIGVELFLDLPRGRDVGEQGLGDSSTPPFLVEDRLAKLDAFAANIDVRDLRPGGRRRGSFSGRTSSRRFSWCRSSPSGR